MTARGAATEDTSVAELVEKARQGDKRAFGSLVELYKDKIYSYVSRMLQDPSEAQDVTQEAFVRAYEALPAFRGASSFRTWLYRIASNLAIDSVRGRKRRGRNAIPLDQPLDSEEGELAPQLAEESRGPAEEALSQELQQKVQEAILELSPKLRPVLILYDLQGMSYREIAQTLGCPLGTVKSRLFNARNQLKDILEERLGPESFPIA